MQLHLDTPLITALALSLAACAATAPPQQAPAATAGTTPVVIGESFGLDSQVLGEHRVINVYLPPGYAGGHERYPVLYMPNGGVDEDFPHVAGFVDVSIKNAVIRPMLVVGVKNTERRRDLVAATRVADEQKVAPHAGGADRFRRFLGDELKPYVAAHYRVTAESAIIGESLAGLFVLETLLVAPGMFDSYIAVDPSVWWDQQSLVRSAAGRIAAWPAAPRALFVTTSEEPSTQNGVAILVEALTAHPPPALVWHYVPLPDEHHSTIFPVSEIRALRTLFAVRSVN